MPVAEKTLVLEIAAESGKEALVAYSDGVLDHATKLVISHKTRNLSAEVVLEGSRIVFRCGQISAEQAARLKGLEKVLWTRIEGARSVAVGEIRLEHHH